MLNLEYKWMQILNITVLHLCKYYRIQVLLNISICYHQIPIHTKYNHALLSHEARSNLQISHV